MGAKTGRFLGAAIIWRESLERVPAVWHGPAVEDAPRTISRPCDGILWGSRLTLDRRTRHRHHLAASMLDTPMAEYGRPSVMVKPWPARAAAPSAASASSVLRSFDGSSGEVDITQAARW